MVIFPGLGLGGGDGRIPPAIGLNFGYATIRTSISIFSLIFPTTLAPQVLWGLRWLSLTERLLPAKKSTLFVRSGLTALVFWWLRAMSFVSASVVLPRTIELLGDPSIDLLRVRAPRPEVVLGSKSGLGKDMLLWDIPDRPTFVIDEADLPY